MSLLLLDLQTTETLNGPQKSPQSYKISKDFSFIQESS